MFRVFANDLMSHRTSHSSNNIQVFHNHPFPLRDLMDIFYPLFASDYSYEDIIHMITTTNHVFCSYNQTIRRCIACALVNNAGTKGGLYIVLFGVRSSSQSHGVGTQLLKTIIQWARRRRYTFIYLHVNADNYKAMGLYEKVGFRRHEYLPNYYQNAAKENPAGYRMILTLS